MFWLTVIKVFIIVMWCNQPLCSSNEDSNIAVRKQYQKLVEFIRNGKLHSALPTYVIRANWGKLVESLEVYSMLNQISDTDGFPEEVWSCHGNTCSLPAGL